jgi:hypothetical protein
LLDARVVDVLRLFHRMRVTLSSLKPFLCHGLKKHGTSRTTLEPKPPASKKSDRRFASHSARTASCNGTGQPWSVSLHP